jgi:hypothetical protein
MMELKLVTKMVQRLWQTDLALNPPICPPEAKVITGKQKKDAYLHYLETEVGLEVKLDANSNYNKIIGYNVIDEEKFMLFVLKWS